MPRRARRALLTAAAVAGLVLAAFLAVRAALDRAATGADRGAPPAAVPGEPAARQDGTRGIDAGLPLAGDLEGGVGAGSTARDGGAGEEATPVRHSPPVRELGILARPTPEEPPAAAEPPGGSASAALPACGAPRTLRAGEELEVPELDAALVPHVLERAELGAYVTVRLLAPGVDTHRTSVRPGNLDFRPDAPLEVRLLDFDPAARTVRLACRLTAPPG